MFSRTVKVKFLYLLIFERSQQIIFDIQRQYLKIFKKLNQGNHLCH